MNPGAFLRSSRYRIERLGPETADRYAAFLRTMRRDHWGLTSSAFTRRPERLKDPDPVQLVLEESAASRIGTFVLLRHGVVQGGLRLDYSSDRRSVVFSGAEALPGIQRRGILAACLARPCLASALDLDVTTFQMTTWWFNRKAFPLYDKAGFRIVPNTSVILVSFFPLLYRHLREAFGHNPMRFVNAHLTGNLNPTFRDDSTVYRYAWDNGLELEVVAEDGRFSVLEPANAHHRQPLENPT